jgi:hypothetical protein
MMKIFNVRQIYLIQHMNVGSDVGLCGIYDGLDSSALIDDQEFNETDRSAEFDDQGICNR